MKLSKHFTVAEFNCHDGTPVPRRDHNGLQYLCRKFLEPLRTEFGQVTVLSGYRTERWNKRVGGASRSFHVYTIHDGNDQAADVRCKHGSPEQWYRFLNSIRNQKRKGRGGLGLYPKMGFVHVDLRDYRATWKG